jgi:hypothetical protein
MFVLQDTIPHRRNLFLPPRSSSSENPVKRQKESSQFQNKLTKQLNNGTKK